MVDPERAAARLERLRKLIVELDRIHVEGEETYLGEDESRLRMAAERGLELAIQICIDLGTQLLMEGSGRAPESYADVFRSMAEADLLPDELAERLSAAAKQRNLLVHLYMEIDDKKVFASLASLDDLRRFAEIVGRKVG